MFQKATTLSLAAVAFCSGLGVDTRANADLQISTPTGLTAGDTFRIAFVTDGMTAATSTTISTYNSFVASDASTQAGGGNVTYEGTVLTWSAIGSTATTSAINNIGVTGASVWSTNGTEIATTDSTSGLWSGSLLAPIDTELNGGSYSGFVWTGTYKDGTPLDPLGAAASVEGFTTAYTSQNWVAGAEFTTGPDVLDPMYGISQVLTVPQPTAVPEPSTLVLAVFGAVSGIAYGRSRRCRE